MVVGRWDAVDAALANRTATIQLRLMKAKESFIVLVDEAKVDTGDDAASRRFQFYDLSTGFE